MKQGWKSQTADNTYVQVYIISDSMWAEDNYSCYFVQQNEKGGDDTCL